MMRSRKHVDVCGKVLHLIEPVALAVDAEAWSCGVSFALTAGSAKVYALAHKVPDQPSHEGGDLETDNPAY